MVHDLYKSVIFLSVLFSYHSPNKEHPKYRGHTKSHEHIYVMVKIKYIYRNR
jgi:hypothetical protein